MNSVRGQSSIQMLLTAEQDAQKILSESRKSNLTPPQLQDMIYLPRAEMLVPVQRHNVANSSHMSCSNYLKTERLRQAKEEADQEAAAYRSSLEREYQRNLAEGTGNSGSNVKRLEEETNRKIQELKDADKSVSSEVVCMLLHQITTIKT